MKCPKCSYLSFEAGERCRNCGYDFSMAAPQPDDPAGDLPLFDESPLVSVPAAPRAPLSVRRHMPDPARLRSRHAPPAAPQHPPSAELDLEFDEEPEPPIVPAARAAPAPDAVAAAPPDAVLVRQAASGVRRLGAAAIDLALIAGIDAAVLNLTLRLTGQNWQGFALPIVPLAAFFVLLNGGYFVMFTAATGQTIGKMTTGIRVVAAAFSETTGDRVTFGTAVLRTAGYVASLLPAGLGFVPAFLGRGEHRALHDRLADTRVVRA